MKSAFYLVFVLTLMAVNSAFSQCSFNMLVTGAGPVCAGSTNTLVASGASSYTWTSNAGGGNSATVTLSPSVTTVYTVTATSGTCTMTYPVTLNVVGLPSGTLSVIGSSISCGAPITLSANVGTTSTWTQKASLNTARSGAFTFEIGGKAYLGTGFNGSSCLNDFWEYDPTNNTWTQKANFPGTARYGAASFSIGNKGYVGTGVDCSNNLYQDIWEYNPATNTWTQKNNFGGSARRHATTFVIGSKAYLATGHNGSYDLNDLYEYDPTADSWTQKASLSVYRNQSIGFSMNGKGYFGAGNYMGNNFNDLYEYTPGTNSWATKAAIGGTFQIVGAKAFTLGNKAYIVGGTTTNEFWEYTPATNAWLQKGYFAGVARWYLSAFALNGKAYMGTGANINSTMLSDLWEFDPGVTYVWSNSSVQPSITVTSSGSYSLTVSNGYGCSTSLAQSVSITTQPTISISGNTAVCLGQSATLTASGASNYTWSTGANTATLLISPSTTTSYAVSGQNIPGCSSSSSVSVISNSVPVISLSQSSTLICAASPVTFTATGANTYTWSTSANSAIITVNPLTNTIYTVNGTSSGACTSSGTVAITTNSLPVITIAPASVSICAQSPVSFTASGAASYTWSNSGGNSAVANYTPLSAGVYTVNGTDPSNGCIASKTVAVIYSTAPVISISGNTAVCIGQSSTLSASGANSYNWSNSATTSSITISPLTNTTYIITGTNSAGCSSSTSISINVNPLPVVSITGGSVICAGQQITLTANGAVTYTWNTNATTSVVSVSPSTNTVYTITGIDANNCQNSATLSLVVNASPSLTISGPSSICFGNTATLIVSGANTFTWNTGPLSPSISITPLVNTNYTVIGTDANSCNGIAVKNVAVNSIPQVSISGNTIVCQGSPTSLLASGSAITYTWNNGTVANLITVSPVISSIYTVTGSSTNSCVNTATVVVFVNALPAVMAAASSTNVCSGNAVTLNGSGAVSYAWSGGIQNNSAFYPTTTSSYTVTGTGSNACINTATIQVVINPAPVMTLSSSASQTICSGEIVTLYAAGANIYNWSTGDITPKTIITPTITSTYQVTGTDANGCTATLSYQQVVDECVGLAANKVPSIGMKMYPNPTTTELIIKIENESVSLSITIFNSLGQKMTEIKGIADAVYVPLDDYPVGIYLVSINSDGKKIHEEKFIKIQN